MESLFFLLACGLIGYEVVKFYKLTQIKRGTHKADNWAPHIPFADFDYTNEQMIEQGNFLNVERNGAAYIYTLPSGHLYNSYFPYSQAVEPNYKLPESKISHY
jgi:hypothetical protein